jgi:hypothetical protein
MGRQSRICGDTCGRPYEGRVDASQRVDTPAGSELERERAVMSTPKQRNQFRTSFGGYSNLKETYPMTSDVDDFK